LIVVRVTFFEAAARDACKERGVAYSGLDNGAGRYADPVPDGARCVYEDGTSIRFPSTFLRRRPGECLLGGLYRLACVLLPITIALVVAGVGFVRTGL
jgi:hypothetical protein